jgi:uncharacterized UBP type Zn finger protein
MRAYFVFLLAPVVKTTSLTLLRHYVAFIRKQTPDEHATSWVLFNDEKVAKAVDVEEMKKFAYIYFFRRV